MARTAVGGFDFGGDQGKRTLRNVGLALLIGGTVAGLVGLVPKKVAEGAAGLGSTLLLTLRYF